MPQIRGPQSDNTPAPRLFETQRHNEDDKIVIRVARAYEALMKDQRKFVESVLMSGLFMMVALPGADNYP